MHTNGKLFCIMFKYSNYIVNLRAKVYKLIILKSVNTVKNSNLKKIVCKRRKIDVKVESD